MRAHTRTHTHGYLGLHNTHAHSCVGLCNTHADTHAHTHSCLGLHNPHIYTHISLGLHHTHTHTCIHSYLGLHNTHTHLPRPPEGQSVPCHCLPLHLLSHWRVFRDITRTEPSPPRITIASPGRPSWRTCQGCFTIYFFFYISRRML